VGHNAPDLTPIHNRRDDDDAPRQDELVGPAAREHAVHEGMDLAEVGEGFPGRDADRLPEHLSVCLVYANEDVARAAEFREQNVAGHAMSLQAQDRQPPEHRLARPGTGPRGKCDKAYRTIRTANVANDCLVHFFGETGRQGVDNRQGEGSAMGLFSRKPKRIVVRRYRALTERGARSQMERDANKMAEKGYRLTSVADKSHKLAVQHGDIFATYELV
jgi:hypothetical protein